MMQEWFRTVYTFGEIWNCISWQPSLVRCPREQNRSCSTLSCWSTSSNTSQLWAKRCGRRHIALLPFQHVSYAVQKDAQAGFAHLRGYMCKSSPSSGGSWGGDVGQQASRSLLADNQMGENGENKERLRTNRMRSIKLLGTTGSCSTGGAVSKHCWLLFACPSWCN